MRIGRIGIGVVAVLGLASCTKDSAESANTVHATSPVNDHPVHEKSGPAPTEEVRPRDAGTVAAVIDAGSQPVMKKPAEVEISGNILDAPPDSDLRVFVRSTPCEKTAMPSDVYTSVGVKNSGKSIHYETEIFVAQGSVGHVCVYASKGGKIVAFAQWPKELVMQGEGEVVFAGVELKLKKP
ncbi:MAG: hypothetical protein ACJ790_02575 [Myxococcaceae bacterium]